jgi:hypothetical protein
MTRPIEPYTSPSAVLADRVRWSVATLDRLVQRGRAEGWLQGDAREVAVAPEAVAAEIAARLDGVPWAIAPMHWLAERLGLAGSELDLLWLLATMELAPAVARLARAFGSHDRSELDVQIALELVPVPMRTLDRLQRLSLIELADDPKLPLPHRGIRIHDRVLELVRGEIDLDRELAEVAEVVAPPAEAEAPEHLVAALTTRPSPLVLAVGPDDAGRATLLMRAAAAAGHPTLRVRSRELARDLPRLDRRLRAIAREAVLLDALPIFDDLDDAPELWPAIELALGSFRGPVMATARAALSVATRPVIVHRPVLVHRIEPLDLAGRRACWSARLGDVDGKVIDEAASRYALPPGAIVAAARNTRSRGAAIDMASIHSGVAAYFGDRIGPLATRVDWRQSWDDLVLPADQFEQVVELVARVRHRGVVLDTWGFADKIGKGTGIAALFSGPPGTGKTMVAGLVASELGLDLYQVDLSRVVSKYIGETEKSLAALFDAAEAGHAVLLFDEADALFGKRTQVKSSNDRYANLEVNYLLQRLEAFTGIAILTTNHAKSIDDAFRRRLAIHVRFPVPDEGQREQLWRAMLPARAAVAPDVAFDHLARAFEMSGGNIKNAVIRAAFRAAEEGSPISNGHLWQAARAEYEAMGKVVFQAPRAA